MSEPHRVNGSKRWYFIVYDGRAHYDPDEALVMETIGEYVNFERVWYDFVREWGETDCLLYAYEERGENLVNGRPIYNIADLKELR